MKHTCTKACKLKHFIISDFLKFTRLWDYSWVCCKYTIYICINFTCICMECCCQCYCCSIRTTSAKRCVIIIFINSLETCNYNYTAVIQFILYSLCVNPFNPCSTIICCCMHCYLECIH